MESDASNTVLRINELVVDNRVSAVDESGVASDWVELVSLVDVDLSLAGYTISDDEDDPAKHVFADDLVLPARGYLRLWADGMPELGSDHLGFSLSDEGESLGVYAPMGGPLDLVRFGAQSRDLAAARLPDGSDTWVYTYRVTPGAPNGAGAVEELLPPGSTWRYLDGGADPGSGWVDPAYDDGAWASGPAPLGYGDVHQVTIVDHGGDPNDKAITTYMRGMFVVLHADEVQSLELSLLRDDGAAVYINGVEVLRDNLPEGALTSDVVAEVGVAGADETTFWSFDVDPSSLVDGVNVVAVEVHQSGPTSSDLGFDLGVSVQRLPTVADAEEGPVEIEELPELPDPVESQVFQELGVQEVALHIDAETYASLAASPREYHPAIWDTVDAEFEVAVRVKGNSTFRSLYEKPSLKVKFDEYEPDREYWGLPSVNLHNMTYDPSMIAESLAYHVYREAGWPAPRTGYLRLTINGEYRGLYAYVEQKNSTFMEHWFADPSGSVYEAGSFNWPCDVDDLPDAWSPRCDCYEHDRVGEGDSTDDLRTLCQEATLADDKAWRAAMQTRLDWDAFLGTTAVDMAIAHIDSYGANLNNYHIMYEPTAQVWYWTPWSTDLAFGWYPWGAGWCGTMSVRPSAFTDGYMTRRCLEDPVCATEQYAALEDTLTLIEDIDLVGHIADLAALVEPHFPEEPYFWYSQLEHDHQVGCIEEFMRTRPEGLRLWMASNPP